MHVYCCMSTTASHVVINMPCKHCFIQNYIVIRRLFTLTYIQVSILSLVVVFISFCEFWNYLKGMLQLRWSIDTYMTWNVLCHMDGTVNA